MSSSLRTEPSVARRLDVIPSGKVLGAELRGVDLKHIDDADFAAIHQAWVNYSVLLVRGQQLADEDLIAFSRRLGDLDWAPIQETGRRFVEGHPEIYVVSNVIENGSPIGSLGAGEATWHTDMSYLEAFLRRPACCMRWRFLPSGGNTYFCGMYHAYESLPDALKHRIAGRMLKHDGTYNSGGYVRQGVAADRRSAKLARRLSSAGLHPSRNWPPAALSGPPAQRLHRRAPASRFRSAAR